MTGDNRGDVDRRQQVGVLAQEQVSLEEEVGLFEKEVKEQRQKVHRDLEDVVDDVAVKDISSYAESILESNGQSSNPMADGFSSLKLVPCLRTAVLCAQR